MKTLFIDRKNAQLEIDRGRLAVKIEGVRPQFSIPTHLLEMLVISAPVQFSSTLLTQLTQENITAVFINPRKNTGATLTTGLMHNDAKRRLWQYHVISQPSLRNHYAQALITQKIRLQRHYLQKAMATRPDRRHPLHTAITRLGNQLASLTSPQEDSSLRGLEGAASAAYFAAYHTLFAPALNFTNRNRRPPQDPVNVILSLTYTLLHAEAVRTLFATGFDPLLGLFHEPTFGRESLACDLVELFRPQAEAWLWRLFATETLRVEYFSYETQGAERPCMLGKRGREVYYGHYDQMARHWRRQMRITARHWLATAQQAAGQL